MFYIALGNKGICENPITSFQDLMIAAETLVISLIRLGCLYESTPVLRQHDHQKFNQGRMSIKTVWNTWHLDSRLEIFVN